MREEFHKGKCGCRRGRASDSFGCILAAGGYTKAKIQIQNKDTNTDAKYNSNSKGSSSGERVRSSEIGFSLSFSLSCLSYSFSLPPFPSACFLLPRFLLTNLLLPRFSLPHFSLPFTLLPLLTSPVAVFHSLSRLFSSLAHRTPHLPFPPPFAPSSSRLSPLHPP